MPTNGVTISVTAETNAGGRKHMEDYIAVNLSPNERLLSIPDMREQAFVGVFDGHGGKEAAKYAREHLWEVIQEQAKFQTQDVQSVREAIQDAYLQLHQTMLSDRSSWLPNKTGDLSTAGTTASTVIFRKNHIFVANVGDSTGIMGVRNPLYGQPGEPPIVAKLLTKDHKPEDPEEQENIKRLGGKVALSLKGVMRVVWERERTKSNGKKETDLIPFLSVARSLGDFWSFNARSGKYTVSPVPYINDFPLDLHSQKFIVIASDGLWNVMTPSDVVNFIHEYDTAPPSERGEDQQPKDVVSALIKEALSRWERKKLQADNIAILIAYLTEEQTPSSSAANVTDRSEDSTSVVPVSVEAADSHQTSVDSHVSSVSQSDDPSTSSFIPSSLEGSALITPDLSSNESSGSYMPNRAAIEYERKIKLRRRKHKKAKKHRTGEGNSRECVQHESRSPSPLVTECLLAEEEDETAAEISNSIPDGDDSGGNSLENVSGGMKRNRSQLEDDDFDDDEGISLQLPSDVKRFKPANFTSTSEQQADKLRLQRLSTDNISDSGSSGVVSDMDSTSSHFSPLIHHTVAVSSPPPPAALSEAETKELTDTQLPKLPVVVAAQDTMMEYSHVL